MLKGGNLRTVLDPKMLHKEAHMFLTVQVITKTQFSYICLRNSIPLVLFVVVVVIGLVWLGVFVVFVCLF